MFQFWGLYLFGILTFAFSAMVLILKFGAFAGTVPIAITLGWPSFVAWVFEKWGVVFAGWM